MFISIVDSSPGIIGAVAAKLSSSAFNFPDGDGDNEPGGGTSFGVPACECLPLSFFGVEAKIPLVLALGLAISPCFLSSSLALLGLHTTSVTTPSVFF